MKLSALTLLILAISAISQAQKQFTYFFDKNLNPTTREKAFVYGKGAKQDSIVSTNFFLMSNNSKIFSGEYTDSSLGVLHGKTVDYYQNGRPQESKTYKMNVQDGLTQKWDSLGRITDSMIYQNGLAIFKQRNRYNKKSLLIDQVITDSLANTMFDIDYDSLGNKTKEIFFVGNKGIERIYKPDGSFNIADSLFTRENKDASFKGGSKAWLNYLVRNLDGSVPYKRGAPAGNYRTIVQFIIEKDGTVSDMKSSSSVGYGMEEEAMRVIANSGKWEPALQYGKVVKAYRKQPITFQVMQR